MPSKEIYEVEPVHEREVGAGMKVGDVDGLDVIYDDEAQIILSERERLYGRRGLTTDAYEVGTLSKRPLFTSDLYMVFYTNQRVVGLRDMTLHEEQLYLGTLRAIDRSKFLGPQAEEHHVLRYFEYPLKEVVNVSKVGRKYLRFLLTSSEKRYELHFRPWGAACRFFSILLRKESA